jgi:hypothetical protein
MATEGIVHMKFDKIYKILDAREVASKIISAQRRGLDEISVPKSMFHMNIFSRLFPNNANAVVKRFNRTGIYSRKLSEMEKIFNAISIPDSLKVESLVE